MRRREGLPSCRSKRAYAALRAAFGAGRDRFGFRLVHYSVQSNHLHFVVEAKDQRALSRGMQGLLIRVAKALNRAWSRAGSVFADRYHARVLRTPREVRNTLRYVLQNARRHGQRLVHGIDYFASGWWFDGWRERPKITGLEGIETPVAAARTWLLAEGWRRHGLIALVE
jgi:REP element-mobilizing transposase RayT